MSDITVRKQKIKRNTVKTRLIIFGTIAAVLIVCSFFSEYLTPYDPYLQDLSIAKQPPSAQHLLGTDRYGRDMLSRVIAGSRASIYSTLLLVAVITVLGTVVGVACGWCGGWLDSLLMRISDVFLAFPGLVFALAVAGSLGGGLQNAIIALAAISWPKYARIARSQTLTQKETTWMKAVRLSGSSALKIICKHILPNILAPIIVNATMSVSGSILSLASLGFLGLGVQPPTAEWGYMLSSGRNFIFSASHIITFPGLAIAVTVLSFNLLGDGLRDALDPRLKEA